LCDQETSYARSVQPTRGLQNTNTQWVVAPVGKSGFYMDKIVTLIKTCKI